MDIAVIVGDALLAGGAVVGSVLGRRALTSTREAAQEARDIGAANREHLEHLRDASVNERIRDAVADYAAAHPSLVGEAVMFDAMRDLLDTIIAVNLTDDEHPHGGRRHRPAWLPDSEPQRR